MPDDLHDDHRAVLRETTVEDLLAEVEKRVGYADGAPGGDLWKPTELHGIAEQVLRIAAQAVDMADAHMPGPALEAAQYRLNTLVNDLASQVRGAEAQANEDTGEYRHGFAAGLRTARDLATAVRDGNHHD